MTETEKIEGNNLIAAYFGAVWYPENECWKDSKSPIRHLLHNSETLHFHPSWDWLMPVVINIIHSQSSDCCLIGDGFLNPGCFSFDFFSDQSGGPRIDGKVGEEIKVVWKAVVYFVKWHFQNIK